MKGETSGWRKSFLTEYFSEPGFPRVATWQAIRSDRWKYIHYPDLDDMDELYDLHDDPYELKNLIKDARTHSTLAELKDELTKELNRTK